MKNLIQHVRWHIASSGFETMFSCKLHDLSRDIGQRNSLQLVKHVLKIGALRRVAYDSWLALAPSIIKFVRFCNLST